MKSTFRGSISEIAQHGNVILSIFPSIQAGCRAHYFCQLPWPRGRFGQIVAPADYPHSLCDTLCNAKCYNVIFYFTPRCGHNKVLNWTYIWVEDPHFLIQDCQIKDRSLLVFVLFIIYMQYNCPVASTMFQVFAKVLSLQAVKLQCSRCSVQRVQSPEARDGQITLVHHYLRE